MGEELSRTIPIGLAEEAVPQPAIAPVVAALGQQATGDKIRTGIDDILDEIEKVMEDNAEEFIRNYRQRVGG